ncbi:hypothetical protein D7X25_19125 [bacterium 1XD42-8]|nr:hypothetical protein D7X25_19125 [bacterium 1XD42-8]
MGISDTNMEGCLQNVKLVYKTGKLLCNSTILKFLCFIYTFRSRKVVISFPSPQKRKISADIKK